MGIVLDSSVIIAFERRKFDLDRLLVDHGPCVIAAITAAELLAGVERADAFHLTRKRLFVEGFLTRTPIIPFDLPHARILAARWMELSRQGLLIGDRDLQIAATAIAAQSALATLNTREFQRVDGLTLVDVTSYQT